MGPSEETHSWPDWRWSAQPHTGYQGLSWKRGRKSVKRQKFGRTSIREYLLDMTGSLHPRMHSCWHKTELWTSQHGGEVGSQVPALADTIDNWWLLGKGESLFFRGLLLAGLTDPCGWPHTQEQHSWLREGRREGGGKKVESWLWRG